MRKILLLFAAIVSLHMTATEGALPGKFTINAEGDQVQFSQGNLQYTPKTKILRFAEHQYDFVGDSENGNVYYVYSGEEVKCNNNNGFGASYGGWRDYFCWGTGDDPVKVTNQNSDFPTFTDWGVNPISNGGNEPNLWRTLSREEWDWILFGRENAANLKGICAVQYEMIDGTIGTVPGLVLLPDDWEGKFNYWEYTLGQWESLNFDQKGAVFLPCVGHNSYGTTNCFTFIANANLGYYWTASAYNEENVYYVRTGRNSSTNADMTGLDKCPRKYGCSVRLVLPCEKPEPTPEAKTLSGRFSVAADKQVIFSQGNLRYKAKTNEWAFANSQYSMIGQKNENISANYQGWIDLFGWGTGNNPTENSKQNSAYNAFIDWTTNTIVNGGDETWLTLSADEWDYLLNTRPNSASKQGQAVVNDVKGYILLPDNWTCPAGISFSAIPNNYTTNIYTLDQWTQMEDAGAVFLPAAGSRYGTDINAIEAGNGYYWTGDLAEYENTAKAVTFTAYTRLNISSGTYSMGYSIRPARYVNAEGIDQITNDQSQMANKVIRDGMFLIEKNGKTYNAQGAQVK